MLFVLCHLNAFGLGMIKKTEKQILQESWFNQGQVFEWCVVPQETNGPTSIKSLILSKDNQHFTEP